MFFTLLEAAKASRNELTAGVFKSIATADQFLSQVRFTPTSGESVTYLREKSIGEANFIPPGGTVASSSATFDKVTVPLRQIAENMDLDNFPIEQQKDTNNQLSIQVEKKMKALGRQLGQSAIIGNYATGNILNPAITGVTVTTVGPNMDTTRHGPGTVYFDQGAGTLAFRGPGDRQAGTAVDVSSDGVYLLASDNPSQFLVVTVVSASLPGADVISEFTIQSSTNEYDGLFRQTAPSQTTTADDTTQPDGRPMSFDLLDELIDEKVKIYDDQVIVMNAKLKRKYAALVRALGGVGTEVTTLEGINGPVMTYRDRPILQTDWIPNDEAKGSATDLSSVFLVSLTPGDGFHFAAGQGTRELTADTDPMSTRILGARIKEVGELEDYDARRWRATWKGATKVGSNLAIARASEIITA